MSCNQLFYADRHMSFIDMQITRVRGEDHPRPTGDPGIPLERLRRYRELMRELGLKAVGLSGETITCRVSKVGRSSKGYVMSSSRHIPCSSITSTPTHIQPEGHAHVKLDGRWSLFYGWQP